MKKEKFIIRYFWFLGRLFIIVGILGTAAGIYQIALGEGGYILLVSLFILLVAPALCYAMTLRLRLLEEIAANTRLEE